MQRKRLAGIACSAMVLTGMAGPAWAAGAADAMPPPAVTAPDAPRFAGLGTWPVGLRTLRLVNQGQPDLVAMARTGGRESVSDRALQVHLWFPAQAGSGSPASMSARLPRMGRRAKGPCSRPRAVRCAMRGRWRTSAFPWC
jgi:hypothetical protein